jgi:ABC-2 type transport system permease protein
MPILDQGYQHWNGSLAGHALRWLTITRQGVRAQLRNRWVLLTLFGALVPALVLGGFLIVWGLFEQQSALLTPFLFFFRGLPEELRAGPKGFRLTFWTLAYELFFRVQVSACMILTALVGPDLISQDLRFNALPLYFSRPLRRIDYFLGKFGVIAVFLLAVLLAPAVLAYVVGLAFSFDPRLVVDTWRVLAASIAFSLIATASAGLLMLAFSSLSRNSRYVAAMWVGLWMVGFVTAASLHNSSYRRWTPLVSYTSNLARIHSAFLGFDDEWARVTDLFRKARDADRTASSFGPMIRRRGPTIDHGAVRPSTSPRPGESAPEPFVSWRWSAGVLAALGLASVAVLSTRVRSLDRLK